MRVNTVSDKRDNPSFKTYRNPLIAYFSTPHINAFRDAKAAICSTADIVDITMLPAVRIACKKTVYRTNSCRAEEKTLKPKLFVDNTLGEIRARVYSLLTALRGFDADVSSHAIAVVKQNLDTFGLYKPFKPKKLHEVQIVSKPLEDFGENEIALSQYFQSLARQAREAFFSNSKVAKETARLKKLVDAKAAEEQHAEAIRRYNVA